MKLILAPNSIIIINNLFKSRKIMSKKHYNEASVVRALAKKAGVRVNGKIIEVVKDNTSVGNGSWGKIDYLCHVHGYIQIFVKEIKSKPIITNVDDESTIYTKRNKFNMATMAKAAMKRVKSK
jgi:hypothetical protein